MSEGFAYALATAALLSFCLGLWSRTATAGVWWLPLAALRIVLAGIVLKKRGGIWFWRLGLLGGSFYIIATKEVRP